QQKYLCNRHGHDGDAALILPHRDFHQPQKDCAASRLRLIDCPNSCRCVLAFETLPLKFSTAGAASETWRSSCCVLADVSANVCASRAADSRKGVTASSILLLNASDGTSIRRTRSTHSSRALVVSVTPFSSDVAHFC